METNKTLWMLDYKDGHWSRLVPFYATDEAGAWVEAVAWAMRHDITLPEDAQLIHFPHGFTIHKRTLPGEITNHKPT